MKKSLWIIPFLMFLMAMVAVLLLRGRDISPESTVFKTDPETLVGLKRIDAVILFDRNFSEFEMCTRSNDAPLPKGVLRIERRQGSILFIIGEEFGSYKQYIAYGSVGPGYESLEKEGYNLASKRYEIMKAWTYCVDYNCDITFSSRYKEQLLLALGQGWTEQNTKIALVLADKSTQTEPAEKSKSAYVVCATARREDGEMQAGYFDPKTKYFIGFIK